MRVNAPGLRKWSVPDTLAASRVALACGRSVLFAPMFLSQVRPLRLSPVPSTNGFRDRDGALNEAVHPSHGVK